MDRYPFSFDGNKVAQNIADMLNEIAEHAGSSEQIKIKACFKSPDVEEVKECFRRNCTVWGTLTLSHVKDGLCKSIEIPVLYPYHGVFVTGNGNGKFNRPHEARLMVWRPCLTRRPGLWFVRRFNEIGSIVSIIKKTPPSTLRAEISFLAGISLLSKTAKARKKKKKAGFQRQLFMIPSQVKGNIDKWKKEPELAKLLVFLSGASKEPLCKRTCLRLLNKINLSRISDGLLFDDDDIETKRLYTYEVFLTETIVHYICTGWSDGTSKDTAVYWKNNVNGKKIGAYIRKAMLSPGLDRYAWMCPFNPRNGAEAVSELTALSRFGWSKSILDRLPPQAHQNHPSFFGRICPVQTPESEMIGLSLHLAAGAGIGDNGTLQGSTDFWGLGYSASLIPFYQHTDSARAMMGAKNYVQALPVNAPESPLVKTGTEETLARMLLPLRDAGLLQDIERLVNPGRNLLVAFMPYFGYNYNDAIVACQDIRDLMAVSKRVCKERIYKDPDFMRSEQGNLYYGEIRDGREEQDFYRLDLGDKLTGRHGNKGVIAAFFPRNKMPRLPDDERLGNLAGRAVDIVLNPLGAISRMNIGQLLESHAALLMKLGVGDLREDIGKPFSVADTEQLRELLVGINGDGNPLVDEGGRMRLTIPYSLDSDAGDIQTESPVMVGVQYFVRLDHIPAEKANFRGNLPDASTYDSITGQASRGRQQHGGQRIGKMEFWALEAYGAEKIIERLLTDKFKPNQLKDLIPGDGSQTFRAIRDWLYAVGIAIEGPEGEDGYRVGWTKDSDIKKRAKKLCYVKGTPESRLAAEGKFACLHPGCKVSDCEAVSTKGTLIDTDTGTAELCVEDLLRKHKVALGSCNYNSPVGTEFEVADGVTIRFVKKNHFTLAIKGCREYPIYQVTKKKEITVGDVLRMPVCCSEHATTRHLVCETPVKLEQVRALGGLADPYVFENETFSWGYIKLPKPIPAKKILGKKAKDWPAFKVVPVLPLRYRRGLQGEDADMVPDTLTSLYEELARAALNPRGAAQFAAMRLLKHLKQRLEGKEGLIRKAGYGRRVDNSGRFVTVPDPRLAWDECGLPSDILSELSTDGSGENIWADSMETCSGISGHDPSVPMVLINRAPSLHRYSIKALHPVPLCNPGCAGEASTQITGSFNPLKRNPRVIAINPLTCISMGCDFDGDDLAVYGLQPGEADEAARLLPNRQSNLLSLANGRPVAEFDQDMVLGTYLISMDHGLRAAFVNEILFEGCEECSTFMQKVPWDAEACVEMQRHLCKAHSGDGTANQKGGIAERIIKWMVMAFNVVTRKGISFGYYDLLACKPDDLDNTLNLGVSDPSFDLNKKLQDLTTRKLEQVASRNDPCQPGFYVAAMVLSNARGLKQIRQIVTARGYLNSGCTGFDTRPYSFIFRESLVNGMASPWDAFLGSMNGRFSMTVKKLGTQKAGTLTNSLVSVCGPWRIKGDDCGFGEDWPNPPAGRSPVDCLNLGYSVCRKCYGRLPDGSYPEDGFPAGLIAAQSIGERGTQLSMKTAHSGGGSEIDIPFIRDILNDQYFETGGYNEDFLVDRLHEFGYYDNVDDCHIQMISKALSGVPNALIPSLSGAESCETNRNLFNALAAGKLWSRLPTLINNKAVSPAKELTAEEQDRIHKTNMPILPPEFDGITMDQFLSSKTLKAEYLKIVKKWDSAFVPSSSPVARILIGMVGSEPEPETGPSPVIDNIPVDEEQEAEDDFSGNGEDDEVEDDEDADSDDDTEDICTSDKEKKANYTKEAMTENSKIALVITCSGNQMGCRVETANRSMLDSNVSMLADCFAEWVNHSCPDLLHRKVDRPLFKTQKELLDILIKMWGKNKVMEKKVMTEFAQRAVLYWDNAYLPVRTLFKKGEQTWACKRRIPSFKPDICDP